MDISCDRAGAIETCVPTSHDEPTYTVDGIRHYCVDNLPSAVAKTASRVFIEHESAVCNKNSG